MQPGEKLKAELVLAVFAAGSSVGITGSETFKAVEGAVAQSELDLDSPALTAKDIAEILDIAQNQAYRIVLSRAKRW